MGEIHLKGRKVSDINGNYMGFIDFDGKRYWDIRDQIIYEVTHSLFNNNDIF